MRKITLDQAQKHEIRNLINELAKAEDRLDSAVEEFNDQFRELTSTLSKAQTEYNEALRALNDELANVKESISEQFEEAESEIDNFSDTEEGEQACNLIDKLDQEFTEIDLCEDLPDEIYLEIETKAEDIDIIDDDED